MEVSIKQENKDNEKIKVLSAEIIVTGTAEKPYYEIKYYDLSDRKYHIGYSSYDLNNVLAWRKECFEIIETNGWIPCSEQLPDNISTVIVQVREIEKPTFGWYANMEKKWILSEKDFEDLKEFSVLAWQPLPEVYHE